MNNNQITSLYELIKQKSKEKGRPLKVVCDYDDCLQPVRPLVIYLNSQIKSPFEEFFVRFWENSVLDVNSPSASIIGEYLGAPDEKKAVEEWEQRRKESRKDPAKHNYREIGDFFNKSPFISTASDLLEALREGLVEKFMIISSYRKFQNKNKTGSTFTGTSAINKSADLVLKEKTAKIAKTFGQLPQHKTYMAAMDIDANGKTTPRRWESIRDVFPDFDIFIDDNPKHIQECLKNFPNDKIYATPDYKMSRKIQAPNCYHVKATISDLKNQDFSIAALEKKLERLEKEKQKLKESSEKNKKIVLVVSFFLIFSCLVFVFFTIIQRKKTHKLPKSRTN